MERLLAASPRRPAATSRRTGLLALALALAACGDPGADATTSATTTSSTTTTTTDASASESEGTTELVDPPTPHTWAVELALDKDVGSIFSLWADGPTTIIAVGGQPMAGVVLESKDGAWIADDTLPPAVPRLSWVHGIGDFRVAVGFYGVIVRRVDGAWIVDESHTAAPLYGVWGATDDDLWAVGGAGSTEPPWLLHYDGGAWTAVDVSGIAGESHALFKVWGRAADDIYAVGTLGLVLHYDGVDWVREEVPTGATLIGLDGDDDEVVIAGGRSSGVVLRRRPDGVWDPIYFPSDEGFDGALLEANGEATVVGRRGFIASFAAEGAAYSREESGVLDELHSAFAVPGGPVLVVGGRFDVAPYTGVILRRVE